MQCYDRMGYEYHEVYRHNSRKSFKRKLENSNKKARVVISSIGIFIPRHSSYICGVPCYVKPIFTPVVIGLDLHTTYGSAIEWPGWKHIWCGPGSTNLDMEFLLAQKCLYHYVTSSVVKYNQNIQDVSLT